MRSRADLPMTPRTLEVPNLVFNFRNNSANLWTTLSLKWTPTVTLSVRQPATSMGLVVLSQISTWNYLGFAADFELRI